MTDTILSNREEQPRFRRNFDPSPVQAYATTTATAEADSGSNLVRALMFAHQNLAAVAAERAQLEVSLSTIVTNVGTVVAVVNDIYREQFSPTILANVVGTVTINPLPLPQDWFVTSHGGFIGNLLPTLPSLPSFPFITVANLTYPKAATDYNLFPSDPVTRHIAALRDVAGVSFASSLATRIEELREYQLEDDGTDIDRRSLAALVGLVASGKISTEPTITLDPEGRVIASWKEDVNHLVLLRLINEITAHFVLFIPDERRPSLIVRMSGEMPVDSALDKIAAYGYQPWQ